MLSFDMLSFLMLSFDMLSLDSESLDMVSFFMSSAKAAGASGAMARPAAIRVDKNMLFFIRVSSSGRLTLRSSAITEPKHVLISFRCRKLVFGSRFCENDPAGHVRLK